MGCCGKTKTQPPPLTTRAANLGLAVLKWGLSGFKMASEEVYQERLQICQANTCGRLLDDSVCTHPQCGCPVARKAALATESCPLQLWLPVGGVVASEKPKTEGCQHKYVTHVFTNLTGTEPVLEITSKCRLCGMEAVFPDYGYGTKLSVRIEPKSEVGT